MSGILFDHRPLYQVYPFEHFAQKNAIKTPQRFEICNGLLNSFLKIPVQAMFARRYFSNETKAAAEKLMKIVVADAKIVSNTTFEIIAGYPNDMADDSFLDRVYGNLSLNGDETLLVSYQELELYQKMFEALKLSPQDEQTIKIENHKRKDTTCSFIEPNYLCKW